MEYKERYYRDYYNSEDLRRFNIRIQETDINIGVSGKDFTENMIDISRKEAERLRNELEAYFLIDPDFKTTFLPHDVKRNAPVIAADMAHAGRLAGVGPMAAVAGVFAEYIGKELLKLSGEVIVENGGDIFISTKRIRHVGIFAGQSPFSNKLGIEVSPEWHEIGMCTSSGTVGPSFSFGRADAAVVLAKNTALADAAATAIGNVVTEPGDVQKGAELASQIPGLLGAVVIKEDKMAVWGDIKVVPILMNK